MTLTQTKPLVRQAREFYPTKHLQRQWVRKTAHLLRTGKHALWCGQRGRTV